MATAKLGPGAWRDYEPTEFSGDESLTNQNHDPAPGEIREERPPAALRDALTGRNGRGLS
ncbi:hypothetical protein ACH4L7_30100 [Streptomyces anulatus]